MSNVLARAKFAIVSDKFTLAPRLIALWPCTSLIKTSQFLIQGTRAEMDTFPVMLQNSMLQALVEVMNATA